MNINLNLYKYFYVVAKCLSYTKAADELMISQPSLSYSIKTLEEQIGKKLFVRTSKGIVLTNDGNDLYNKIKPLIEEFEKMDSKNEKIGGDIIIGTRNLYAVYFLPPFLQMIDKLYPEVNVIVKIRYADELYKGLLNEEFDMIIDDSSYEEKQEINTVYTKDKRGKLGFYISKKFSKNYENKILGLNEINGKLIVTSTNKYTKELLEKYPKLECIKVKSTMIMENRLAKEDLIGFINSGIIDKELKEGTYIEIESNLDLPETKNVISTLKSHENVKIRAIRNVFVNYDLDDLENME